MTPEHFPAALRTQLQPILQGSPQPAPDRPIHPGQFWHLSPALQQYPARTIYEILPDPGPPGHHRARPWLPMNPHSHLNPVQGDTYYWTPQAPHSANSDHLNISLSSIPPTATWTKILCQPIIHADQSGKLIRRILSPSARTLPK